MLDASDVGSIGQALDLLFNEPSIVGVAERGRFVYGHVRMPPDTRAAELDIRWTRGAMTRITYCEVPRLR